MVEQARQYFYQTAISAINVVNNPGRSIRPCPEVAGLGFDISSATSMRCPNVLEARLWQRLDHLQYIAWVRA